MKFTDLNLNPHILKALNDCQHSVATSIQEQSIPVILNGDDLIGCAQTGTGKTAAYMLPALQLISERKPAGKKARILILSPTRELSNQITSAAGKYGKYLRFGIANFVGGMPYKQQLRTIDSNIDIIVATPGRLMDLMQHHRLDLSGIEMLVLDEADRMLDMGFIEDVEFIAKATPKTRQTLLFSATVDKKLSNLARHILNNPQHINITPDKLAPSLITQKLHIANNIQHKTRLLDHLLANESIFKAIIFSGTRANANNLSQRLRQNGYLASALHGDLKQSQRNKIIEQLKRGKIQYLVATDVAARGIDIAGISHIINYDLPKFPEDYVHRIGRTGRAGESGIAISFALPSDARALQKIERYTGQRLSRAIIEGLEPNPHAALEPQAAYKKHGLRSRKSSKQEESGRRSSWAKPKSNNSEYDKRKQFGSERVKKFASESSKKKMYFDKSTKDKKDTEQHSSRLSLSPKPRKNSNGFSTTNKYKKFGTESKFSNERRYFGERGERREKKPFGEKNFFERKNKNKQHSDGARRHQGNKRASD